MAISAFCNFNCFSSWAAEEELLELELLLDFLVGDFFVLALSDLLVVADDCLGLLLEGEEEEEVVVVFFMGLG